MSRWISIVRQLFVGPYEVNFDNPFFSSTFFHCCNVKRMKKMAKIWMSICEIKDVMTK